MEASEVGQGEQGVLAAHECRRCRHWKRTGATHGECFVGATRENKHQHDTCEQWGHKTFMSEQSVAWVAPSGAKSSFEMPRFDLVYPPVVRLLAERLGYGGQKHGDDNYKQGAGDRVFARDRLNHLHEHVLKLTEATTRDAKRKHYAAILANVQILLWLDDHEPTAHHG